MVESLLSSLRIVLVEPAGPLNVGSIARVMKNMGLTQLTLVKPQCDPLGTEARQMAVHASDVLETAQIVATLPEALRGCQRAIATTARARSLTTPLEHPRAALPWLLETSAQQEPTGALIFGPEDRGLSNEELNYAQRFVCIPSSAAYPSINLAQAVAICCYEVYQIAIGIKQETTEINLPHPSSTVLQPSEPPAGLDTLEGYYHQLEALLLKIGYLYPHTADSRMQKFRRLFGRALPSNPEVAMLRGVLSQMEWALQQTANNEITHPPLKD